MGNINYIYKAHFIKNATISELVKRRLIIQVSLKHVGNNTEMTDKFREYNFEEWLLLSEDDKRKIINDYWNPFKPEIGQKTREKIIQNFKEKISDKIDYCEFRYFGFYASALFVIPNNSKTRIPTSFAGLTINKGKIKEKLEDDLWKIKWTHSGTEELKINKSTVTNNVWQ